MEDAIASQYNCEPVRPYVPYKWPLALDLLMRNYDILFSDHTFERLTPYFNIAKTCRVHLFGVTGYFTTDPENIRTILADKFADYSLGSRRLATYPMLGEGIFSQDGPAWRRSRELIRQQFVRVHKEIPEAFTSHINSLLDDISQASIGGRVDLKPLLFDYTLNTTTALLFGEPYTSMTSEEGDVIRDSFDHASFGCGIRVRLADAAFLYRPARFRKACKTVRDWATCFASNAITYKDKYGEEAAAEKYPFIIDLWKEMQDFDLVRDQLLHVLVAGRDSTASLLCWTV
jgi:cytochrome P450